VNSEKIDIHNREKRLLRMIERVKTDPTLIEDNRKEILRFKEHMIADSLSSGRITKYMFYLSKISRFVNKPFKDVTKDDMVSMMSMLETDENKSECFKADIRITSKKFFKWFRGIPKNSNEYPPEVAWISTHTKESTKLPEDVLVYEDVIKMSKSATNPRDCVIPLFLFESGLRSSEMLTMRMRNVMTHERGFKIIIPTSKTGQGRTLLLITCQKEFRDYLNTVPHNNNGDQWVWVSLGKGNDGRRMTYAALRNVLRRLANRTDITKSVHPHGFRTAAATYLSSFLTERQLKMFLGHVPNSRATSRYVILGSKHLEDALLVLHGLVPVEKKFNRKVCPRCNTQNSLTTKFCETCSYILDSEVSEKIEKVDKILEEKLTDPRIRELLSKILLK